MYYSIVIRHCPDGSEPLLDRGRLKGKAYTWRCGRRRKPGTGLTSSTALRKKTDLELFGYIAIITRNRAIDIYRRQKSEAETVTFDEAYSQTELMQNAPTGETDEAVKLILRLSEEHRDILILKYYYGFSVHEVADMLKLPYDTVKSRMKRAKKLLKDELNKAAKKA